MNTNSTQRLHFQIGREVKKLIEDMLILKDLDLPEYCLARDEIKRDLGKEFYDKYLKEHLEV